VGVSDTWQVIIEIEEELDKEEDWNMK